MKRCKGNCGKPVSILEDYCSKCRDELPLREKLIQAVKWDTRTY